MRSTNRGFTIIEMLVAIAIGLIAAGIAIPTLTEFVNTYRLVGAASNVGAEINRARVQAIAQSKYVKVGLSGSKVCRMTSDDNSTFTPATCASATEYYELPSGVSGAVTYAPTFQSNGIATTVTSITLTNGAGSRTVAANVLGRVKIS